MGVKEKLKQLYQLKEHKMKLGLQPTFDALAKLGNPHKNLRFIHVTGTNGKGSTCAFIADTLQLAGYKVGLFTSPHLVEFNERLQVSRKNATDEELAELIEKTRNTGVQLTFFEYATVMGILHFLKHKVDFVVWEVGLGGTFDSTNVVDAEIAVLTNIGLDHTHILGDTIEKITRDKCGIIKKKSKVVTCEGNAGLPWIEEKCKQQGNQLFIAPPYDGRIKLLGEFQKKNAGIAKKVCELLGIKEDIITKGLASAQWPGRLEWMEKNVLVDCGHNPAAIQATAPFVNALPKKRLILIFGVLRDKDYKCMIASLPKADVVILTKPKSERAIEPKELPFDREITIIEEPGEAYQHAKKIAQPGDIIFVVGSCYLVGNIKESLIGQRKTIT
ncbi:MAG: folylpolyglutamate synthase/dihydrofolate synthase family protein [Candidatus Woesearchaeota archaeon]